MTPAALSSLLHQHNLRQDFSPSNERKYSFDLASILLCKRCWRCWHTLGAELAASAASVLVLCTSKASKLSTCCRDSQAHSAEERGAGGGREEEEAPGTVRARAIAARLRAQARKLLHPLLCRGARPREVPPACLPQLRGASRFHFN